MSLNDHMSGPSIRVELTLDQVLAGLVWPLVTIGWAIGKVSFGTLSYWPGRG